MKISLIDKNSAEIIFENIRGFRAGIAVLTVFDKHDNEHKFFLEDFQAIYINHFDENK